MRGLVLILVGAALVGATVIATRSTTALRQEAITPSAAAPVALSQARQQVVRARERATVLDRQARAASQESERATVAAAALAARVQMGEAAVAEAQTHLSGVKSERRALDLRLARERAPALRLMAGLQTLVRRPSLLVLLQPGSLEDTVHLRAVVGAIGPRIRARTATLRSAVDRANQLEAEAARIAAEQRDLQAGLLRYRADLATLSAAERLKAQRAAGAADREAERALAIGEQTRTLSTLTRRLEADQNRTAPRGSMRPQSTDSGAIHDSGRLAFRSPVTGRRIESEKPGDRKLIFAPPPRALVVAPAAGRVAFAGLYRGYGSIVIVEHADGLTSLLTGLAAVDVVVGQQVVAGSPLGRAADGASAINLELRRKGQPVDPRALLDE